MLVRFWGTRGSIPKPGPTTIRYGGNTSCVQVTSAGGTMLVLDCGTGAHELGQLLMAGNPAPLAGHILISHTHWDHIQGIPFFAPLFVPGNRWDFYAPHGFGDSLRETLAGQMEFTYFPVTPEAFGSDVRYHDLGEGSFEIDDFRITTRFLNHPALTLAYRIESGGATVVYACDHEPHARALASATGPIHGQDRDHGDFLAGADLVIHDAQYTPAEYEAKVGWGHSTPHYAAMLCRASGVRRLAFTHHDPSRTDDEIDALVAELRAADDAGAPLDIVAAAEGMILRVEGAPRRAADLAIAGPAAARPTAVRAAAGGGARDAGLAAPLVLVVSDALDAADPLGQALSDEKLPTAIASSADAISALDVAHAPSLVILDDDNFPGGLERAGAIGKALGATRAAPPMIVASSAPKPVRLDLPADSDWIERPFSREFARARIRTALMRSQFHWLRPATPDDEQTRLAALHALKILDTPPEERFDRVTRLAAALFRVPVALVSLVDANRQWFKSCVGIESRETSREVSFCAHAVADREMLVVTDALRDPRFADNPLVTDEPHVRFYAGAPLFLPQGACTGTLCLVDTRPRDFSAEDRARLLDLADIVEYELVR